MSNNSEKETEKKDGIQRLIKAGVEIAGGAVGGTLGSFAGGPIGAAVFGASGAVAAMVLNHIGQEVSDRLLSSREEVRIGAVLTIAIGEIRKRIENGESLRVDGFFDKEQTLRSDAEEVAESILLKSQREPEEKKLQYMGHLLSSVAFDPHVGVHMAHQIIKTAEQLTYRQFCILKLAVVKDSFGLRNGDYKNLKSFAKELYQVLYECFDLYHKGYINFGSHAALGLRNIEPGSMKIQGLGFDIFYLMNLSLIPTEDIEPIAIQLK